MCYGGRKHGGPKGYLPLNIQMTLLEVTMPADSRLRQTDLWYSAELNGSVAGYLCTEVV